MSTTTQPSDPATFTPSAPLRRPSSFSMKNTEKTASAKKRSQAMKPPVGTTRALSVTRSAEISSDGVNVTSRFDGQSRCIALGRKGTAWTGEADGSIVIRAAPMGYEAGRIAAIGRAVLTVLLSTRNHMWAGYNDGSLRIFDLDTAAVVFHSTQHTAAVLAMCEADGKVFTGGSDWKIHQWDVDEYRYERMLSGHKNSIRCLCSYSESSTGETCLVSGSDDGTLKIWKPESASESACIATLDCRGRSVLCSLILQDTAELWAGSDDGVISIWDLRSKDCIVVLEAHRAPVVSLQQVEDTVWSGNKSGSIVIIGRDTKDVLHEAVQPPSPGSLGNGRFTMVMQPVQRTVVHNVWVTNLNGSWQCWSCVCNDVGCPAPGEAPPGHRSIGRRSNNNNNKSPSRSITDGEENLDMPNLNKRSSDARSESMEDKDAELRQSVARTRQYLNNIVTGDEIGDDMYPTEDNNRSNRALSAGGDGARGLNKGESEELLSSDDDDTELDLVERSLLRDHADDMRRSIKLYQDKYRKEEVRRKTLERQLAAANAGAKSENAKRVAEVERERSEKEELGKSLRKARGEQAVAKADREKVSSLEAALQQLHRQQKEERAKMDALKKDIEGLKGENAKLTSDLAASRAPPRSAQTAHK